MGLNDRLSSQERLILIRVKIERAKKHLEDLDVELTRFRDSSQKVILEQIDPATGNSFEDFTTLRRVPFNVIACAGDVVHNLRSALDHLANQLVWVGSGQQPSRNIEFPIAKDEATYERDKVRKVHGMRQTAIEAIDALKPYRGGNDALWRIHELDVIDKHRTLFTVGHDTLFTADWIEDFFGFRQFLLKATDPDFALDSDVEKDIDAEIGEAINKSSILKGYALLPTLHQFVDFVEGLVLGFEPLLR